MANETKWESSGSIGKQLENDGNKWINLPAEVPSLWNPRSARFQMIMLLFGIVFVNTMIRNTMSMGIVCMVNNTHVEPHTTNSTDLAEMCGHADEEDAKYEGPFEWNSRDKGVALSAIFWGGLLTVIPLGFFADRQSSKRIIELCLMLTTIGCVLTPIAALTGGLPAVFILRFIMGFGDQATIFATASSISARWIPPDERTTAMALYTTGAQLGMMVAGPLNAFLCQQTHIFDGWQGIFYFTGLAMLPIILAWFLLAADTPENYKLISKPELQYIQDSLAQQHLRKKLKWSEVPWRSMLLSLPLLATFVVNFSTTAMVITLQSYLPLYFKQSLHLNLRSNGLLNVLPFLAQALGKVFSSPISDRIRSSKLLSATWTCKIFNAIGTILCSAFLMLAAYMTCTEKIQAITFLTISSALYSFQLSGFLTSLLAIAPAYTGIVNAMSRFFGQLGAVVSPLVVGPMTPQGTTTEWRNVFWLMSGLVSVSGFLFLIFGSAEIQNWAKLEEKEKKEENGKESNEYL